MVYLYGILSMITLEIAISQAEHYCIQTIPHYTFDNGALYTLTYYSIKPHVVLSQHTKKGMEYAVISVDAYHKSTDREQWQVEYIAFPNMVNT